MRTLLLSLVIVSLAVLTVSAQPHTYTCSWTHDGINTDSYMVLVDGTAATINVTCSGTGDARTCETPLTMTQNVSHTVIVRAVGPFGSADSIPFVAAPPTKAVGLVVK